jgi:hypothetical protein
VDLFETQCQLGVFKLSQIRTSVISGAASDDELSVGHRAKTLAAHFGRISPERCSQLRQNSKVFIIVETSPETAEKRAQLKATLFF